MGDKQQWIKIDEVISAYLDRSEQSVSKQFKIWNIAFDGLKTLGLDFFSTVKSVKLPINANLTVTLPADFMQYSKVGVFNDRSEIIPLYYNSNLTLFADGWPNRSQVTEDNTLGNPASPLNSFAFYNYWNGYEFFSTIYGVPSGGPFIGSFRIDNSAGVILLNESFSYPYIVLEYVANPKLEQNTYFLPFQFKEALIAFIGWQDIQYMPATRKGNRGDKEDLKRNFYNERRLAIARYQPFHIEDWYEEQMRAQRLCVKI